MVAAAREREGAMAAQVAELREALNVAVNEVHSKEDTAR